MTDRSPDDPSAAGAAPPGMVDDDDLIHLVDEDPDPLEEIEEIAEPDPTEVGHVLDPGLLDPGLLEPLDDETTGALRAIIPPPPSMLTRPPPPPPPPARPAVTRSMLPPEPEKTDPIAEVEECLSRLERIDDPELRGGLFRKLGRILLDDLEDPDQAYDVLVVAYGEDVEDDETGDMLERAADGSRRWATLVATANAWLSDPAVRASRGKRVALMRRLASWYGERLGRIDYALPYLRRIGELAANDLPSLRVAARIHRRAGDVKQESAALEAALRVATSPQERRALESELGDLYRVQDRPEPAIAAYRRALEIDASYGPALDALKGLYEERGMRDELGRLLEQRLSLPAPPGKAQDARLALAEIRAASGALAQSIALYREVLGEDPTHRGALAGLVDAAREHGDWDALRDGLARRADAAGTARERRDHLLELGVVLEDRFLDFEASARTFEAALALDPSRAETHAALVKVLTRAARPAAVVEAFGRWIGATGPRNDKADLLVQQGRVMADALDDLGGAAEVFEQALRLAPEHAEALEALAVAHAQQGDPTAAVEGLRRVAERTRDPARRATLLVRIAEIHRTDLDQAHAARACFREALDLDADNVAAMRGLRLLAKDRGDVHDEAAQLERLAARAETKAERGRLLVELGDLELERDRRRALEVYGQAEALEPQPAHVARVLAEELVEAGEFARALPLLERAARGLRGRSDDERSLHSMLGRAYAALGRTERAAEALEVAHRLDPTDAATTEALADAAYALDDFGRALTAYERLLAGGGDDDTARRAKALHRIGTIKREQGNERAAWASFQRALEVDPDHRETLESLARTCESRGAHKDAIEYRHRIADLELDRNTRADMLDAIARTWLERVKDPRHAVQTWEEALLVRGEDIHLLHKMLPALQQAEDWEGMVDVLERILAREGDPHKRAKYRNTIGQVLRDKLDRVDDAEQAFDAALDDDPSLLRAFEAIDRVHTQNRAWRPLERAYRKMLHRVTGKGTPDVEFHLWQSLGLIYRDRLGERRAAREAFAMAAQLRPNDGAIHRILAELHGEGGDIERAAEELQVVLRQEPARTQPYRELYKLYRRAGHHDRAAAVARTLAYFGKADAEQLALAQRAFGVPAFRAAVDPGLWSRCIVHPDVDELLGKIFELIVPAARALSLAERRAAEPPPQAFQEPRTTTMPFARAFFASARVLGLTPPRLAVLPRAPTTFVAAVADPPLTVASAAALQHLTPTEVAFRIGVHLSDYRGGDYVKCLFPSSGQLKTLLLATMSGVKADLPVPPGVSGTAKALARFVTPVQADGLRMLVRRFLAAGGHADVKRWMQTTELTALRAGFLLSGGDLAAAASFVSGGETMPWSLPAGERLKSLIQYSVSEPYFAARKALGIAI